MASEEIRQRTTRDDEQPTAEAAAKKNNDHNTTANNKGRRQRRTAMARRGIRSLAVAVVVPIFLQLVAITYLSAHRASPKPASVIPPWALHGISVGLNSLMGFCAWLIWAEGGFHRKPTGFAFFLCYLVASLLWDPIVFGLGEVRAGLALSGAMVGALAGCYRVFKDVNPIASDLIKLSMIWAVVVATLNLKLLFS